MTTSTVFLGLKLGTDGVRIGEDRQKSTTLANTIQSNIGTKVAGVSRAIPSLYQHFPDVAAPLTTVLRKGDRIHK